MKQKFILTLVAFLLIGEALAQFTYTYTGKPRFDILTRRHITDGQGNVIFIDTLGTTTIELFPNIAPRHTRNFDSLVSVGFYDSTAFHRVIPNFMIQGGDPNSRSGLPSTWGTGQAGQPTVMAEFTPAKHRRGIVSAARTSNPNSATSQFFICHGNGASVSNLNGQYSVYGRVTSGISWVDTVVNSPRNASDRPLQKIDMFVKYIGSNDTVPVAPVLTNPPNGTSVPDVISPTILGWQAVSDAILYRVEVAGDSLFTDSIAYFNTADLYYNLNGLQDYGTYYWRVRTNNGGHFSPWSPMHRFHTTWVLTGAAANGPANTTIAVFPNPSAGKFNFSGMEKGSKLRVFDMNGRLVHETIAKENNITLDLDGKEKGVYFYQVSNQQKELQRGKLVVK